MDKMLGEVKERFNRDPILQALMIHLANSKTSPEYTTETTIRQYATDSGFPTTRKSVRGVVLFLSNIGAASFHQDPERRMSRVVWEVDAVVLAKRVLVAITNEMLSQQNQKWSPSDDEINSFMESL